MASLDLSSKYIHGVRRMGRRPPIHNPSDRPRAADRQVAYIGEGLIDPNGLDSLDLGDIDIDKSPQRRRNMLDHLAIDVGEKYLDDIYKEDESGDKNDGGDEPQVAGDQTRQYISDSPSVGLKERVRTDKELAWLKVRQLLIEEEEKASTNKRSHTRSTGRPAEVSSAQSEASDDSCDTVKLLDAMAQSSSQPFSYGNMLSSDKPQSHSFADRVGSKLSQFLPGSRASGDDSSASTKSSRSQPSSACSESRSTRWALLATLEQVTRTCQRMELSDASLARVSSHLAAIDQIVRDDIGSQQKTESSRLSSTQWFNDSSDYEAYPVADTPSQHPRAHVAPTVRSSFKAFASAQDLCDTLVAFNNLVVDCSLNGIKMQKPWHMYFHIRAAVYSKLSFRQKQLFKLLDARFNLDVYKRRPGVNKRVCIVGAGPVGLRAAVELALLGSEVSVLETRTKFNRENMLHLWPWVVQDLASLGAKVLHSRFCKSRTYFHVSTRQVQVILLKVALLVGVKIHADTSFQSILSPEMERRSGRPFYSIKTEPQIPVVEYTAVLGATGVNDQLAEPAGINRFVFSQKESLGIVCYFPNLETADEMKVKEFSWTTQLKHQMLHKLREVGVDLENIVYFRGEMHYLVMTPKRNNLLVRGVVNKNIPSSKELVNDENINHNALHAFVNRIVEFAGIPRKAEFSRVNLFDFSSLTRADKAASILTSRGKKLYIGLIGDSLLEPVWHEGVGTCRGFLSALDGVWMVAQIGKKTDEQILADRESAYEVMQRLSGHHRDEMQKNVRKYTVDPRSRYRVDFARVV